MQPTPIHSHRDELLLPEPELGLVEDENNVEDNLESPKPSVTSFGIKALENYATQFCRAMNQHLQNFVQIVLFLFKKVANGLAFLWDRHRATSLAAQTLIQYLRTYQDSLAQEEGVFRLSPTVQEKNSLKTLLLREPSTNLDLYFGNHPQSVSNLMTVSSLLKDLYKDFNLFQPYADEMIQLGKKKEIGFDEIANLIKKLSSLRQKDLKNLMNILSITSQDSGTNKMDARNLAICIGPNLCSSTSKNLKTAQDETTAINEVVECMIRYYGEFFPNHLLKPAI